MMGFNHDHDPYHAIDDQRCRQSSDNILYGLLEEQPTGLDHHHQYHNLTRAPVLRTSTAPPMAAVSDSMTPVASPDLLPCATSSDSRSSSFSLSRSSSFSVPALGATASPSLAEVFLSGPSNQKEALQQYLMGLANTTASASSSGGKRKRKSGDGGDSKKKRKSRRTAASAERTKAKSAERANRAAAQRTKATATVATVPETTTTTAVTASPHLLNYPAVAATSTPVVSSPAVPYSSPSLYFSSMPSPSSSFSASSIPYAGYPTPTASTPSDYYPNVLFDAPAPAPAAAYQQQPQSCRQPQYEDDDFWLDVEAIGLTQHQQRDAFYNSSFCELERFLLEHDL
jgi:hypothetical protein